MALGAGTRLGPYEIQAAIGAGGMGEVYRARDTRLDRTVAIKVVPSHVSDDPAVRERFEREARAVAALNHPHICTLHDVGHQDGVDFLVMEHLDGESLAQRLTKGPLSLDSALRYAIEIVDALDKAHRAGIVHRDLKPGNIMITRTGAKLLDFGLAKATPSVVAASGLSMAPTLQTPATLHGTILGTMQYMAPEQIEGQETDARTDIFAFGCVLYEMLTRKRAFEGKTQASLIAAVLERQPPQMATLVPLMPAALDWLVSVCLAKEPDERWQSAGDITHFLKRIAGGADVAAPRPVVAQSKVRSLAPWVVAAAAAVAAIGAFTTTAHRAPATVPLVRFDITTPPTRAAASFAISPDGRSLVFVATVDGASKLWLRRLDGTTPVALAGTEEALYPFWSPDSRSIAFFADGKLKRIDIGGGAPQTLASAPTGRGGTWSRDGIILFTADSQPGLSTIMRVAATGGAVTQVTHLSKGGASHRWPQFLPDGRRFLFFSGFGTPDTQGTYVASLDGGEPSLLSPTTTQALFVPPRSLLFVRQDTLMAVDFDAARGRVNGEPVLIAQPVGTDSGVALAAFSASTTGLLAHRVIINPRRQLVWVDRQGVQRGTVGLPDQDTLTEPELSPDGRQVAVRRAPQGNLDIWLMDLQRPIPNRFTFDASPDTSQLWSSDGRTIVFTSNRGGTGVELFEKAVTGATEERSRGAKTEVPESWSPDGRFLLYANFDASTGTDLWALPMVGDPKAFPVVQTRFEERRGQFSPDGRWVAYESNESGQFEIYARAFPGSGARWQVSTAGGMQVRWRRDGKELFYVAPDGTMMAASISVSADRQTLNAGQPIALFKTHLATGGGVTANRAQYDVAADGRFLLNTNVDDSVPAPPITIVQNWQAALGK